MLPLGLPDSRSIPKELSGGEFQALGINMAEGARDNSASRKTLATVSMVAALPTPLRPILGQVEFGVILDQYC